MAEKNRKKSISKMSRLLKSGQENGKLEELKVISGNLKKKDYGDADLKRDILPILNSYNKSIPITSLSKEAIKKIKEILNSIK